MLTVSDTPERLARDIGERVAGPAADDVDRNGRFPHEAVAELRRSGLLGAMVPAELGGPGASVQEMALAVCALAQSCASSALVLAMHSIQVACLARHAKPMTLEKLTADLLHGNLLLANANSEVGLEGERRSSLCALEPAPGGFRLEKQVSTLSYGEYADGVLATARRDPSAPASDQVLAVCLPPSLSVIPTGVWDTLGMRGTCSSPCRLSATLSAHEVIEDYPTVFTRTSLPVSAVLLSSVWLGLAEAGARAAHRSVRAQARRLRARSPDAPPPAGALRLAELGVILHQLREVLSGGAREFERVKDSTEVSTLRLSAHMDNLKLASSTLVNDVIGRAMFICGMAGYTNRPPVSIGRLSRDAAAAPLMVNNDRALMATAQSLLIRKDM